MPSKMNHIQFIKTHIFPYVQHVYIVGSMNSRSARGKLEGAVLENLRQEAEKGAGWLTLQRMREAFVERGVKVSSSGVENHLAYLLCYNCIAVTIRAK